MGSWAMWETRLHHFSRARRVCHLSYMTADAKEPVMERKMSQFLEGSRRRGRPVDSQSECANGTALNGRDTHHAKSRVALRSSSSRLGWCRTLAGRGCRCLPRGRRTILADIGSFWVRHAQRMRRAEVWCQEMFRTNCMRGRYLPDPIRTRATSYIWAEPSSADILGPSSSRQMRLHEYVKE